MHDLSKTAVIIPAYKVRPHLRDLVLRIDKTISYIFIVDDCCPDKSYQVVEDLMTTDNRIKILKHEDNQGVGGAMVTGYKEALKTDAGIIVKIDGDGQMPPELINRFTNPIILGKADYTKGSRFYSIESLKDMPKLRIFGNAGLSFINKVSSGYWNVMDPTNGFTAIHRRVLKLLPLEKIEKRYFFESDMLFRLGTVRAVVKDIPMDSIYGEEESNLDIKKVIKDFPPKYFERFLKRIVYIYFIRDFNSCSIELVCGVPIFLFGLIFGIYQWISNGIQQVATSSGTVMLAGLPVIVGLNLIISAINFDVTEVPKDPIHPDLED